jgi:hypothetical protein
MSILSPQRFITREPLRFSIESQQIGSRLLPGDSGGEIKDGSFFQQNPHRLANRMPMPWQNGHSRYSGSGPNASKLISSFHFFLSRSVVTEGSPIPTCASLDISQSTAVTTERREEFVASGIVDCWLLIEHPPNLPEIRPPVPNRIVQIWRSSRGLILQPGSGPKMQI